MVSVNIVGRVGALAVALGVGVAVASATGVASAAPDSSNSSSGASSTKKPGGAAAKPGPRVRGTAGTATSRKARPVLNPPPAAALSGAAVPGTTLPGTTAPGAVRAPGRARTLRIQSANPASAALRSLPAPGGDTPNPVAWAVMAYARREIGNDWLRTYVNFEPWINGSAWLPPAVRPLVFHSSPVVRPVQVEVDLDQGVTSAPIPFSAYSPDGGGLLYSVPGRGLPGGPVRGTVTVDNVTGTFTYTPDESFTGTDTFSYVANDGITPHVHAWESLFNGAFGVLGTGLDGGHRATATVTVFNGVPTRPDPAVAEYTPITGEFSVLTYGVGGARWLGSLQIGSLLNGFDIVNVQQDLAYRPWLLARTAFPDRTAPSVPTWAWPIGVPFSDGLNSFSAYDIESLQRQGWAGGGANPLTPAGFTYSRQHIPGGSSVDVYNVDTSAGPLSNDDLAQLSDFIRSNSTGRAVIVTGDFGQLYSDAGQTLSQFAADNGLTDAWVQLEYGGVTPPSAPTCAYSDNCEQPDKVFYRSAAPRDPGDPATSPVRLQALSYTNEGLHFLDPAGRDLSGHRPQSVEFGYSVDGTGPANVDLANWMGSLPGIADLPLTALPFPGTHDSGSYGITARSPWALTGLADFGVLTELPGFIVKPIAAGWAKTQSRDLYGQFEDGIRYVDLRLSNEPDGQIYIEHGLRGPAVDDVLADIARYADSHPKEVIIVDAARFTNFTPQTHAAFLAKVEATLGPRMAPRALGTDATLGELWAADKNVIVVYADSAVAFSRPDLWYSSTVYGPWPNVQSADALLAANERNLANRSPYRIWSMSGQPTPDTTNIVMGILTLGPMSNRSFMWPVHPALQQWLRVNFKDSVNLVTTDWYDAWWPEGSSFSRDVITAVYETLGARAGA